VLDQRPALQHGDLGHAALDADRHRVAADGPALAATAAAALAGLGVQLDGVLVVGHHGLDGRHLRAATALVLAVATAPAATLAVRAALVLAATALAAAPTSAATAAPAASTGAGRRALALGLLLAATPAATVAVAALLGGRGRAGVADLGPADGGLLGRLGGRPVLGDALRQLLGLTGGGRVRVAVLGHGWSPLS
jgi:hypothetical protein